MKILGRRGGVERRPFWKRKGASVRARRLDVAGDERLSESTTSLSASLPISAPSPLLSPRSTIVSNFIIENARKTHDSIQDETERRNFILDLRDALKSVGGDQEQSARRSLPKAVHVIDFFAEAMESTMLSIENEEERIDFKEHLSRELFDNFDYDEAEVATTN